MGKRKGKRGLKIAGIALATDTVPQPATPVKAPVSKRPHKSPKPKVTPPVTKEDVPESSAPASKQTDVVEPSAKREAVDEAKRERRLSRQARRKTQEMHRLHKLDMQARQERRDARAQRRAEREERRKLREEASAEKKRKRERDRLEMRQRNAEDFRLCKEGFCQARTERIIVGALGVKALNESAQEVAAGMKEYAALDAFKPTLTTPASALEQRRALMESISAAADAGEEKVDTLETIYADIEGASIRQRRADQALRDAVYERNKPKSTAAVLGGAMNFAFLPSSK
ncbi:hypothetical protein KIPB_005545 [Kipferlia bialata]|uniref:Uncharacterized protein n=1 Tax=Kipferlia bialata TaxID=797122 RepID=A0A391NLW7_9EUKA|nr:hypothetical protein KIPB_005545 [Kipferlia bialata]|eukprot:g5545.t1